MRAFVDEVTETSALPACRVPFESHSTRVFRQRFYTSPKLETSRRFTKRKTLFGNLSNALTWVNRVGFCLNVTQSFSVALSFSTRLRIVFGSSFRSLKKRKFYVKQQSSHIGMTEDRNDHHKCICL